MKAKQRVIAGKREIQKEAESERSELTIRRVGKLEYFFVDSY